MPDGRKAVASQTKDGTYAVSVNFDYVLRGYASLPDVMRDFDAFVSPLEGEFDYAGVFKGSAGSLENHHHRDIVASLAEEPAKIDPNACVHHWILERPRKGTDGVIQGVCRQLQSESRHVEYRVVGELANGPSHDVELDKRKSRSGIAPTGSSRRQRRRIPMSDIYHSRRAGLSVKTSTVVGDYPLSDLLRPRLTPLIPNTKTPIKCEDGGPRWSQTGPLTDDTLDRWAQRYRPGWAVRTGLLDGLNQASLIVVDVDLPDDAPDWTLDEDLFPWRVSTRRGVHLYGWNGEPLRSRRLPYGDLKAERSYVVVSQPSGAYRPAPTFGVGQIPLWSASILADLLRTESPPVAVEPVDLRPDRPQDAPSGSGRRPTPARVSLPIGHRNAGLFDRLCVQAGRDADIRGDTARLTGLARWHNAALAAPLPDSEVVKLAGSVSTYSASWETSTAAYRERQRVRGQRSGEARRARTGDRDATIVAMRAAGLSSSAIARQVGVTTRTVYRIIKAI